MEALSSKWDGVRVTAARVLLGWGDEASVEAVRQLLPQLASKPVRWAATGAVAQSLAGHLRPGDLDWALEVFHQARARNRFALVSLFEALPAKTVLLRLAREQSAAGGKLTWELGVVRARALARLADVER